MKIHTELHHDIYILQLAGRWDTYSTASFEESCSEYIEKGMRRVILDLAQVDYISSLGLRSLLNIGKKLDPLGGVLVICNLHPHVEKLFVGSGFSRLFTIYPDVQSAQNSFDKNV